MKNLKYFAFCTMITFFLFSCNKKNPMQNSDNEPVKENSFSTAQDAVMKGKNDLIALLKSKSSFQLNIDQAALERANPDSSVKEFEVDFEKFLKDSLSFSATESGKTYTPLVDNGNVIVTIATSKTEKGFSLNEIINNKLTSDLSLIRSQFNNSDIPISKYEVPNINATVYEVNIDQRQLYFSDYNGRSLREPVAKDELLKQLKADALQFERKFGDQVKKQKLVK